MPGVVIEEGAGLASAAWHPHIRSLASPQLHCGDAKRQYVTRAASRLSRSRVRVSCWLLHEHVASLDAVGRIGMAAKMREAGSIECCASFSRESVDAGRCRL